MQCNVCGITLPAGAVTCPSCGANVPSYVPGSTPYIPPSGSGPYPNYGSFQEAGAASGPASQPPAPNPYLYSGQAYTETPPAPMPYGNQPYMQTTPAPQPFPTQQPRQRRAGGAAALLFLLALLLIAAGALVYYTAVGTPAQLNAQATAIAQKFSTDETRTASTTPQGLYDSTTRSRPQLTDPLNNGSSTWLTRTASDHGCSFNGGAYHVTETSKDSFYYCTGGNNCSNCLFQVQMTIVSGDAGGIMLRVNQSASQFYRFSVYSDGSYRLYKYVDNTGTTAQMLLGGISPLIPTATNKPILIAAVASSNNLYMYINKRYIGSASDTSFSNGELALFATDLTASADVAYSNAQEWNL
ncbi:MAG: hypothetical protein ABI456_12885 [Ktedonobacteraceae bacterium]|nr:hypothetical protein [Chloroflexota bacterium]